MMTDVGARVGGGAETSGAPSPSEGIGARPVSIPPGAAGLGTVPVCAGAATSAPSGATRASVNPLRLPNTLHVSKRWSVLSLHQLGQEGRQHPAARALCLGAASQRLRQLAEHFCGFM